MDCPIWRSARECEAAPRRRCRCSGWILSGRPGGSLRFLLPFLVGSELRAIDGDRLPGGIGLGVFSLLREFRGGSHSALEAFAFSRHQYPLKNAVRGTEY